MSEWSRKQWVELESTKAFSETCGNDSELILSIKDVDEEIELALSFTSTCMCTESMQPPAHVGVSGLLTNFFLQMRRATCPWVDFGQSLIMWLLVRYHISYC